jgi:hypothetical protein
MSPAQLVDKTRELADRLRQDISCSTTREEHIRTSARANEAAHLLNDLLQLLDERASLPEPSSTSDIAAGPVA